MGRLALRIVPPVLLLSVHFGSRAEAETCFCSFAEFDWAGCSATACDPAAWAGCDPSSDDAFRIEAGCSVRVGPGADVLLDQAAGSAVSVESGGSLEVSGPVELRLGPSGLEALPGSSVSLRGCFRSGESGTSHCDASGEGPPLFSIGRVVPCRNGDCASDPEIVRLAWDEPPAESVARLLDGVDPERDALCLWQPSEAGYVGADAGYCYAITGAGRDDAVRWLEFDVRQVWNARSDQAGYPLEQRLVRQGTLAEDHPAGERTLRFVDTELVRSRTDQMGRWVRCGGGERSYLVASVVDAPEGDALFLADDRGLREAFPADTPCWIDWGWHAYDQAFVMAPVHVTSRTNQVDQAFVRLRGDAWIRAAVFDGLGGDGPRGALQLRDGTLHEFRHVWVVDPLVTDQEAVLIDGVTCGAQAYHLTITGGPAQAEHDKNYGLAWFGGPSCHYELIHYYTRHRGDDDFVLESKGNDPIASLRFRYVQAGPSSAPGDSGQFFDFGTPNATEVHGADALCVACTSQDGRGALLSPSQGEVTIQDVLWVGTFNNGVLASSGAAESPRYVLRRLGVVGSAVDPLMPNGKGQLVGPDTEDFYVRDVVDPRAASLELCTATPSQAVRNLRRGVFHDVALGSLPCRVGRDALVEDVYFVDVARLGPAGPVATIQNDAVDVTLRRLTFGFRYGPVGLTQGLRVGTWGTAASGLTLDGLLLSGFRGDGTLQAMQIGSVANAQAIAWGAPTCFWDNDRDDVESVIAAYGAPPLRGLDPGFVNPAWFRFDLVPDGPASQAGCGARPAGIARSNWAHQKAKLAPTWVGPRRRCGLLGIELLPLIALARRRARGPRRGRRRPRTAVYGPS